jgi:hypothetical protein
VTGVTTRFLIGLMTALSAWLAAGEAGAISCGIPYHPSVATVTVLPSDGSVDVPANALVWVGAEGALTALLEDEPIEVLAIDEDGEEFPLAESMRFSDEGLALWIGYRLPQSAEPGTRWTVEVWAGYGEPVPTISITLGTGANAVGPPTPNLISLELESGATRLEGVCASGYNVVPDRVTHALDSEGLLTLVARQDEDVPFVLANASVTAASDSTVVVHGEFNPGGDETFRYAAIDLAGNLSPWSEPVTTSMPLAGCSRSETPAAGLLLIALGFGLSRRRLGGLLVIFLAAISFTAVAPGAAFASEAESDSMPMLADKLQPSTSLAAWDVRLTDEARVLGGWSAGSAGFSLTLLAAQPFRPPNGPSAALGSVVGWGPTFVGLGTVLGIRGAMRTQPLPILIRDLRAGFVATAIAGGLASGGATVLAIFSTLAWDTGGGLAVVWMSLPGALVAANIALGVNLGRALRVSAGLPPLRGPRRVELVAAWPLGFVLLF